VRWESGARPSTRDTGSNAGAIDRSALASTWPTGGIWNAPLARSAYITAAIGIVAAASAIRAFSQPHTYFRFLAVAFGDAQPGAAATRSARNATGERATFERISNDNPGP